MKQLVYYIIVLVFCDCHSQNSTMYNKLKKKTASKDLIEAPKWENLLKKFVAPTESQIEYNKEKYFINGFAFDSVDVKKRIVYFPSYYSGAPQYPFNKITEFRALENETEKIYKGYEDSVYVNSYSEIVTDHKIKYHFNKKEYPLRYESSYVYYSYKLQKDPSNGYDYTVGSHSIESFVKYIVLTNEMPNFNQQKIEFGEGVYYDAKGKPINIINYDKGFKKTFFNIKDKLFDKQDYIGYANKKIIDEVPYWELIFKPSGQNKDLVDFKQYINGSTGELINSEIPKNALKQNAYKKIIDQNNFRLQQESGIEVFAKLLKSTTESIVLNDVTETAFGNKKEMYFKASLAQKDINLFETGIILKANETKKNPDANVNEWITFENRYSNNVRIIRLPKLSYMVSFSGLINSNEIKNKHLFEQIIDVNLNIEEISFSLDEKVQISLLGYFEKKIDQEKLKPYYSIIVEIKQNELIVSLETYNETFQKHEKDTLLTKNISYVR